MSAGWSWFVIALVALNILGCVWLIWWTGRRKPGDPRPTDTSHVWDGDLTEYNKPMPRWWINLFYITIVFSIGYLIWYPGLGAFAGMAGWTSQGEHEAQKATEDRKLAATFARYEGQPIDTIARDPNAIELGRAIFANTCATCHGSSAQGAIGYPNLADDIWQWGGTPEAVLQTVLDGRDGVMPPWGAVLEGMGGEHAVPSTAAYVLSLSQGARSDDYFVAQGKRLYGNLCVACHGVEGKGDPAVGAPDLTDDYWQYGSSRAQVEAAIRDGLHGKMPAHRELLGETRSRVVAAYVWSLSHGERRQAQAAAPAAERQ